MSEKLTLSVEKKHHNIDAAPEAKRNIERIKHAGDSAEKEHQQRNIESMSRRVESLAISGKEVSRNESEQVNQGPQFKTKELKLDAYRKTIRQVQTSLNPIPRAFSKIAHQPAIEKISDISAQTIARPWGVLIGGVVALLGSFFVIVVSRKIGFEYNYSVILILYIAGYSAGSVYELARKSLKRD
jgi:hypothetical protein